MPALAMRFDGRATSSSPPRATEPRRWPTIPMMARSVVVLPAPLRPSSVTTSPSPTVKFIPCRMCDSPYQACRSPTLSSVLCSTAPSGMTGPHIGLHDLRILRDRGIVALGENAAARQHADRVGEVGDDRKIVLDHEHSAVGGNLLDERRDAGDVLVAEA